MNPVTTHPFDFTTPIAYNFSGKPASFVKNKKTKKKYRKKQIFA